jgi:pheromone shutdown-related protein TraB
MVDTEQPYFEIDLNDHRITVLGTAHVSRVSAEYVRKQLETGNYDGVAVELCPARFQMLRNPDSLAKLDLFAVIRSGKAPLVAANLALGAYQQRLAEQLGIQPGAEMQAAIDHARRHALPVWLLDRDVGITLRRTYRSVPWWQRMTLLTGLLASVVTREKVDEAQIERLKQGDMLESTFSEFASSAPAVYDSLIDERDRYMAARLREKTLADGPPRRILAVVGAGHLGGIHRYLEQSDANPPEQTLAELDRVPPANSWLKRLPWLVVALIVLGFALGFSRNPSIGWAMVSDWVLINGVLAAVGAALALAHPLTILGAFIAAPLTSLNPTIGAGMVTAALELWLRKPRVSDFSEVRAAAASVRGWWHNRVTRVLLVFLFSTLGSALGTYIAGFRILEYLV